MKSTFIVYMHTFKTTGKSYIGYTKFSISERLARHIKNAFTYGIDTHFYRALRRYGVENLTSKIIDTADSEDVAKALECKYIDEYNTLNKGYNMTVGGTGGITVSKEKDPAKYEKWYSAKLKKVQGEKNPRYSGYTDSDLIDIAINLFKSSRPFTLATWRRHCSKINAPLSFSKMRFNSEGCRGFIRAVKRRLEELKIEYTEDDFKYKRTIEHSNQLRDYLKSREWWNDGIKNYMLNRQHPDYSDQIKKLTRGKN
jgi:hypothetical protein